MDQAAGLVFGLTSTPIPEDCLAVSFVAILKVLHPDGKESLTVKWTAGMPVWDRLGMLHTALTMDQDEVLDEFEET